MSKTVDIVVPCFNEHEVIGLFYERTKGVVEKVEGYDFSFIFVDDGSKDATLADLQALAKDHPEVKYLSFSRNFGKEAAIYAGLSHSKADFVILMDGDLQHPPEMIPEFVKGIEEGYDSCVAKRSKRAGENPLRAPFSNAFFNVNNKISTVKLEKGAVDFRMVTRRVVDTVLKMSEKERFSKGLFAWAGFDTKWIDFVSEKRAAGKTKWSFFGLGLYAFKGLTSFSRAPLVFVTVLGFIISIVAFIYIIITLVQTLIYGIDVPGYVTTLCAVLFLGGIIEISIGILGGYIGHIYMETKNRPMYVLKTTNIDREETSEK